MTRRPCRRRWSWRPRPSSRSAATTRPRPTLLEGAAAGPGHRPGEPGQQPAGHARRARRVRRRPGDLPAAGARGPGAHRQPRREPAGGADRVGAGRAGPGLRPAGRGAGPAARRCISPKTGHGQLVIQIAATPHLVEAAVRCGELGRGDAGARACSTPWAANTGNPAWLALLARCRALIAEDEDEAERHFREALQFHPAGRLRVRTGPHRAAVRAGAAPGPPAQRGPGAPAQRPGGVPAVRCPAVDGAGDGRAAGRRRPGGAPHGRRWPRR